MILFLKIFTERSSHTFIQYIYICVCVCVCVLCVCVKHGLEEKNANKIKEADIKVVLREVLEIHIAAQDMAFFVKRLE